MTRRTPFDLILVPFRPEFDNLKRAAEAAGRDPRDRAEFARLPETQRLLGRLGAVPEAPEAYLALLHAAYRFWDAGSVVVAPARAAIEPVLEPAAAPAVPPSVPEGACYLQLPASWFWTQADDRGPFEPLDGCFLAVAPSGREIDIVAVLGLRPGRAGFTQVALQVPPADFLAARLEPRPPFAPLMEGGAAGGFRSVATVGELLILVSLALAVAGR